MLTEQEITNNALKEMLYMEELTAEKYAEMVQQINDPQMQKLLKGMEMTSRNNYKSLMQKKDEYKMS